MSQFINIVVFVVIEIVTLSNFMGLYKYKKGKNYIVNSLFQFFETKTHIVQLY